MHRLCSLRGMRSLFAALILIALTWSSLTHGVTSISALKASRWGAFLGKNPIVEGPNCWNLVLVDLGITNYTRFSGPEEFRESLNQFCKVVDKSLINTADVSAITTAYGSELHGFVLLEGKKSFTKDLGARDISSNISYRIEDLTKTINTYVKDSESADCKGDLANEEQSPCGAEVQFYSCDRNAIQVARKQLSIALPAVDAAVLRSEKNLEDYHWGQTNLHSVFDSLRLLLNELEQSHLGSLKNIQPNAFEILRLRLIGLDQALMPYFEGSNSSLLKAQLRRFIRTLPSQF